MKKRAMVAAAVGATGVVAGLSGCSGDSSEPTTKVTVDGQEQPVQGSVTCKTHEQSTVIVVGDPDSGVIVTLTGTDSPEVQSVVFGDVDGEKLMYAKDMPTSGDVAETTVTKDGKHYTITGTASELKDIANPESKPFEVDATCP